MLKIAKLLALVAIRLSIISCDTVSAEIYAEVSHKEKRSTQNRICPLNVSVDGYQALDKKDVHVQFLRIDGNHIARVRWKPPAAKRVPVDAFLIKWAGNRFKPIIDCQLVNKKTAADDIKPSPPIWNHDEPLLIAILPLPKQGITSIDMLRFTPKGYTEVHPTTSTTAQNTTKETSDVRSITSTEFDSSNKTRASGTSVEHEEDYSVKLILGSVVGVAMAIVLIIILVKSCATSQPRSHKDTYYISQYNENSKFVKELKELVYWLRENQIDVQMLTDEGDMLTERNRKLRREMISFKFREHMLTTADKVFIILSPSYLKLCEMKEDDAVNQNVSEEEKLVNGEIIQIRSELHEQMYRSNRFIPVLFRLEKATSIPFWIKELVFFSWPEDKTNKRLLNWLNGLPEYPLNNLA